jgi:hypothetical protein
MKQLHLLRALLQQALSTSYPTIPQWAPALTLSHSAQIKEWVLLLENHRVVLCLYPLIKQYLPPNHPIVSQLKLNSLTWLQRDLQHQKWVVDIAANFAQQELTYAFLKGPVLNQQLYGNDIRRSSKDIDILITQEDLIQADTALRALGLSPCQGSITVAEYFHLKTSHQKRIKDFGYQDAEKKVLIELHLKTCLSEAQPYLQKHSPTLELDFKQVPVHTLPAEENFLYLATHAAKDHWTRLQWLLDLAVFYQKIPLNWQRVCDLARSQRRIRALIGSAILLTEWFDLKLPPIPASRWDRYWAWAHVCFARKQLKRVTSPAPAQNKWLALPSHCVLLFCYCACFSQKKTYLQSHWISLRQILLPTFLHHCFNNWLRLRG